MYLLYSILQFPLSMNPWARVTVPDNASCLLSGDNLICSHRKSSFILKSHVRGFWIDAGIRQRHVNDAKSRSEISCSNYGS